MFSLLPQLFFLAPVGLTLMRGSLAALLIVGVREQWSASAPIPLRLMIGIEGMLALALAVGFMTQLAALLSVLLFGLWLAVPKMRPYPASTILLAAVMALMLLISGAGLIAFDMPL